MAATGLNQVFDQSQIADAINRQKIGSQRQRREMMRLGETDPNAFSLQNKSFLQQAQQPTEFLGAGRKEVTPNTDLSLLSALGGTTQKTNDGQQFYYSDYDLGKASWGTMDADDIDLGGGKYSIINNGQTLGTGYKSIQDAARELRLKNSSISPTKYWTGTNFVPDSVYDLPSWYNPIGDYSQPSKILNEQKLAEAGYRRNAAYQAAPTGDSETPWMPVYDGRSESAKNQFEQLIDGFSFGGSNYRTQAEAEAARQAAASYGLSGNATRDWEVLGQILNYGGVNGTFSDRAIGGNNIADPVKGENILFGSKPIIYDGKLFGYNMNDVDPIMNQWNQQSTSSSGNFLKKKTTTSWDVGALGMGREYVNQPWWNQNAIIGNNSFTLTPDKIPDNPGWLNKDFFERQQGSQTSSSSPLMKSFSNTMGKIAKYTDPIFYKSVGGEKFYNTAADRGIYSAVFDRLDPILDKVDPGHNWTQDQIVGLTGSESQEEAFNTVAPIVLAAVSWGLGGAGAGAGQAAGAGSGATAGAATSGAAAGTAAAATSSGASQLISQIAAGLSASEALRKGDLVGGALSGLGAAGINPMSSLSKYISDTGVVSPGMARAATNFGLGALGNFSKGMDAKSALASALFSTAGGEAGGALANATKGTLGEIGSKMLGGAASGGISSLYGKNSPIAGSLYGAMSGGLHGFLNSTDMQNKTFNQQANDRNLNLAKNVTGLAKIMLRNKDGSTKTTR